MNSSRRILYMSCLFIGILVVSGFSQSVLAMTPGEALQTNQQENRIDFGDGKYADMLVEGELTTLLFDDGTEISVLATETLTRVAINETSAPQELIITYGSPISLGDPVIPETFPVESFFDVTYEITFDNMMTIQEKNRETGNIETEIVAMDLKGTADSLPPLTGFRMFGDTPVDTEGIQVDSFFDVFILTDQEQTAFGFHSGENPSTGVTLTGDYIPHIGDPQSFGSMNMYLSDDSDPSILYTSRLDTGVGADQTTHPGLFPELPGDFHVDSFFDVFFDVDIGDGNPQSNQVIAGVDDNETPNPATPPFDSYYEAHNHTGGAPVPNGINSHQPGDVPTSDRLPDTSPHDPFHYIDITLMEEAVVVNYENHYVSLYVDKLVINYQTFSGYYLPIVINYITYEVIIIYEYITIITYLQIVELITVIIVYEVVKIEVYISYIVIIYEYILTIIEIVIYYIEYNFYYISINIYIDIWVIQIFFVFQINIFILPVWIVFVPILVFVPLWIPIWLPFPVFIPVLVPWLIPVFIPVPTPQPFLLPATDVDLHEQYFDESDGTMDLSYNVTDEFGTPLTGEEVNVTVNGIEYETIEDAANPGIYEASDISYVANATIEVHAYVTNRPMGYLIYEQTVIDHTMITTVYVPGTDTTLVTDTTLITSTFTDTKTDAAGFLSLPVFALLSGIAAITIFRRRSRI